MKVSFILNARNKASLVGRAVKGALSQTYPCEILLSDQGSEDGTYEAMEKAVAETKPAAEHKVELLRCPVKGAYGMRACNQHIQWLVEQATGEWVFQCSADDYSLPERVSACMRAAEQNDCVGVSCTFQMEDPSRGIVGHSGYPVEDGYVTPGVGMAKLAFGSTIWGYRREWLLKVGLDVPCTLDVYLGFLAACDRGYYVVANPQHVHYMAADMANMGFQGKMRAAEASGDEATIHRVNELNRFQLFELYLHTKYRQQQLYPMAHREDQDALVSMLLAQAQGWYAERKHLMDNNIEPVNRV
jgi:hypothetical protein